MPQAETQTTAAQVLGSSEAEPTEQATPATPVVDEKVSPKLQVLIQRERAAIARERSAKEKETGISTRLQELEAREAKIKEFESIKKTNPMRALEMLDMSYQDLTQVALADGNVTPEIKIRQLEERLKNFENQEAIKAQKQEEYQKSAEQKQLDTTVKTFKSEIGSYIKGNAERYELIGFEYPDQDEANELIYEVIDEHFERTKAAALKKCEEDGADPSEVTGEVKDIAWAADKVEQHLEQKYDKARTLNKVKVLLAPKQEKLSVKPQTPSQKPKTLTNTLSATPAHKVPRVLTDEERIQKAIAYAKGLRP